MRGAPSRRCRGGGILHRRITVNLLVLILLAAAAEAVKYAKICELRTSPLVTLEYDAGTREFSLVKDASDTETSDEDENNEEEAIFDRGVRNLGGNGHQRREEIVGVGRHAVGGSLRAARSNVRFLDSGSNHTTSASTSKRAYIARSCPCDTSGRTYCLIDGISPGTAVPDTCGVPWSDNLFTVNQDNTTAYDFLDIGCFELNSQTVFIRNAWPVVVLWYGALLIFLLATSNGKFARAYIVNSLCPRMHTNERQVERILARETEMRSRLRTAAMRAASLAEGPGRYFVRTRGVRIPNRGGSWRRDDMTEEEERQEATRWWLDQAERLGILSGQVPHEMEYVLRTKTFNAEKERARREQRQIANSSKKDEKELPEQSSEQSTPDPVATTPPPQAGSSISDEDDTFECTICLTEIEDGEQVGVLPCTHVFHVDCLRQWIARKNACPLCQVTEIATPRPVQMERAGSSHSSSESNSANNETGESSNTGGNAANPAQAARPWFFFPASSDTQRARSTPTRMSLSPSSSMSDGEPQLADGGRRFSGSPRHQRRRRREHQSLPL